MNEIFPLNKKIFNVLCTVNIMRMELLFNKWREKAKKRKRGGLSM